MNRQVVVDFLMPKFAPSCFCNPILKHQMDDSTTDLQVIRNFQENNLAMKFSASHAHVGQDNAISKNLSELSDIIGVIRLGKIG